MNSIPRMLLVSFSIFAMCALLTYFLFFRGAALAFDRDVFSRGDTLHEAAKYNSDFSDYDKSTECLEEECSDVKNCTEVGHKHVTYYMKEIRGNEMLRLISKYQYAVKGTILVRNDRTTREYNSEYPFIKNSINNIDYVDVGDNYIAKIIMQKDKPYTMYFYYDGYQLYNKNKLTKVEELFFRKGGHDFSQFQQFTESGEITLPDDTTFVLYACASGKGSKAGQAIAEVQVSGCSKIVAEIVYEDCTKIKLIGRNGQAPNVIRSLKPSANFGLTVEKGYAEILLKAGEYDNYPLTEAEFIAATGLFKVYSAGEDGNSGYDGSKYTLNGSEYSVDDSITYKGGQGGQGGAYGFGGGGGNGAYSIIAFNTSKFKAYQNQATGGGAGYATGYTGINYAKLKNLLPVSFGGIVNDTSQSSENYTQAMSGENGTLLYGGSGGNAGILYSDRLEPYIYNTASAGGGGGGGGYGAGGGSGGYNVNGSPAVAGTPSGGMIYISFNK